MYGAEFVYFTTAFCFFPTAVVVRLLLLSNRLKVMQKKRPFTSWWLVCAERERFVFNWGSCLRLTCVTCHGEIWKIICVAVNIPCRRFGLFLKAASSGRMISVDNHQSPPACSSFCFVRTRFQLNQTKSRNDIECVFKDSVADYSVYFHLWTISYLMGRCFRRLHIQILLHKPLQA